MNLLNFINLFLTLLTSCSIAIQHSNLPGQNVSGYYIPGAYIWTTPKQDGFHMPAEWEPHEAIWMLWPFRGDEWRKNGLPAQMTWAKLAEAILRTTKVIMGVPQRFLAQARSIMPAGVKIVQLEINDAWVRDTGPSMVKNKQGDRRGVKWIFNSWGGHYADYELDQNVGAFISDYHHAIKYLAPLVLEGGSIHTDGQGTILTTESVLLNPNRNPQLTKAQIENYLLKYLGAQKVIWLPYGVYNDETDGHVDNMCCFVAPGQVALTWTDDQADPQYNRSLAAFEILSRTKDAQGRKFKIWKLQQPGPLYSTAEEVKDLVVSDGYHREAGWRLAGSYINFVHTNKQIIFPLMDERTDGLAYNVFKQMFPAYNITGIASREVLLGGGNIHCITQQMPR